MVKLAFYINGYVPSPKFHCSSLVKGNPGLGGTEYMVLLISYLLQNRDNGIDVTMYSTSSSEIPGILNVEQVRDFRSTIKRANEESIDYLVFCHDSQLIADGSLDTTSDTTKLIPWCHNFVNWAELDYYSQNKTIWKVVNVGKEQNDLYIDHPIIKKSVYIYNSVALDESIQLIPNQERENIVTYMGCVWPRKGFHWLAEAWPKVKSEVPDAELYIIGSSGLYGWNAKIGKYGLAEENYEESFIQFLEKDGKLLPDVHIMGILGNEKNDILRKTKVGVPNPTGNTETFCITAVEMQCQGAKVVMGKCPGALDTVVDGCMISKKNQLAKRIVRMLKDPEDNHLEAMSYFQEHFSHDSIICAWERLLVSNVDLVQEVTHLSYRYKWLKYVLAFMKTHITFFSHIPTIERILLMVERKWCKTYAKYQYVPNR